jgi:hypothetical protein
LILIFKEAMAGVINRGGESLMGRLGFGVGMRGEREGALSVAKATPAAAPALFNLPRLVDPCVYRFINRRAHLLSTVANLGKVCDSLVGNNDYSL